MRPGVVKHCLSSYTLGTLRCSLVSAVFLAAMPAALIGALGVTAEEPPALNPFGPTVQTREDAVPGYIELSNGQVVAGRLYMTRDKRVKVYDGELKRQREIPLNRIQEIECTVLKEWMEKEWRFRELAKDEKEYTGRSYPAREYTHTVTLGDGRKIEGPLAEVIYIEPEVGGDSRSGGGSGRYAEPLRFLLHKREKGEVGEDLKSLVYVKRIRLGEEALAEGKRKAAARPYVPSPKK
ncbi:MAG: hypothetical protein Kow0040_05640 [Thermogutta sp.]